MKAGSIYRDFPKKFHANVEETRPEDCFHERLVINLAPIPLGWHRFLMNEEMLVNIRTLFSLVGIC